MKLLFDENLSRKLVVAVEDLFPGSAHVTHLGLSSGTSDRRIWDYARQNGFAIVTADNDFVTFGTRLGHLPKIILLENCDYPTNVAARVIRGNAIRIIEFDGDDQPVLILHL
jgi:predicted nuclease of predicted toxin-antitoxin system